MKEQVIYVQPDGTIESIGDPAVEMTALGESRRERASSIVPLHIGPRIAFLLLRSLFGENGMVAEATRQWNGPWLCTIYETGDQFQHQSRLACIEWEHARLAEIRER